MAAAKAWSGGSPLTAKKATNALLALLRLTIGLGLLVYLAVSGLINWSALSGLAAAWPLTLAALLLLLLDAGFTSWRLCLLLRPCGLRLSLPASVRLTLMGTFFNTCLPGATGGDMVRIYYATAGSHGRRTEVVTVLLLDRATGMFTLMLWPLLAAPFFPRLIGSQPILRALLWAAAAASAAVVVGMLLGSANAVRHSPLVTGVLRRLPFGSYAERVFDTVRGYRHNMAILLAAIGLSVVAHTLTIGATLLAALATNPTGFSWQMSILIPLGFLANMLPVTPGGLGVGEAAFDSLFSLVGLTGGAEALLAWRMLMAAIGLLGLIFYLQGRKRLIHEAFPSQPLRTSAALASIPRQILSQ
jgi:uncharacterized protein (TIRG00374 family)